MLDRLLDEQDGAYFLAVGGATAWPISLPRSFTPRTRSILPSTMLLGIPLKGQLHKLRTTGRGRSNNDLFTFRLRSRWQSAVSRWFLLLDPFDLSPCPVGLAVSSERHCHQYSCASILQSLDPISLCSWLERVAYSSRHWLQRKK